VKVLFSLFVTNIDKLQALKNKRNLQKNKNSIVDYKINLEQVFSHQNFANVDEFQILLQLFNKNRENEVFEINETELSDMIANLKEIYHKIKIN
jgi:hypothetical protein